jgi:hypothetical protein
MVFISPILKTTAPASKAPPSLFVLSTDTYGKLTEALGKVHPDVPAEP